MIPLLKKFQDTSLTKSGSEDRFKLLQIEIFHEGNTTVIRNFDTVSDAAHFAALAEQMRQQGGQDADPQEVADKIYECATEETPVHNIVGADAEMLMGMINSMPRQDFINQIEAMLTPKED